MAISKDLDAPIRDGEFSNEICAESARSLFADILLRAINDACSSPTYIKPSRVRILGPRKGTKRTTKEMNIDITYAKRKYMEALQDRDEARSWLMGGNKSFVSICDLAGFDPTAVREKAEKLAKQGWLPGKEVEHLAAAA